MGKVGFFVVVCRESELGEGRLGGEWIWSKGSEDGKVFRGGG